MSKDHNGALKVRPKVLASARVARATISSSNNRPIGTGMMAHVPMVSQSTAAATTTSSARLIMPTSSAASLSSPAHDDDENENDDGNENRDDMYDDDGDDVSDNSSVKSVGSQGTLVDPHVTFTTTKGKTNTGVGISSRCFTQRSVLSADGRLLGGHQTSSSSSSSSFIRHDHNTTNSNHNYNHHNNYNNDDDQTRAETTSDCHWMDNLLLGMGPGMSSCTSMGTLPLSTSPAQPPRSSSGAASSHGHHTLQGSPAIQTFRRNTSFMSLTSADYSTSASVLLDRRIRGASDLSDDAYWHKTHMIGDVDFHDVFEEESQEVINLPLYTYPIVLSFLSHTITKKTFFHHFLTHLSMYSRTPLLVSIGGKRRQ